MGTVLGEGQSWTKKKGDHDERSPSLVKLQKENQKPGIAISTHKKGKSNKENKKPGIINSTPKKGPAPTPVKLRLERNEDRITKITDLTIIPTLVGGQGGENITGTLEAHVDGFRYTSSRSNFLVDFRYDNLESAFYQVGDDRTPPLLHFHLHDCIMVCTEKTKDIQFRLMSTSMGSKKIENDGRSMDGDRNLELNIFVEKVRMKWRAGIPFEEVEKENEFHGFFPSEASGVFALTFCALVGLFEKPFIVVPRDAVELVYLEQVAPRGEIDMTIVFEDYNREVFQIKSIPSKSAADLKSSLDFVDLKYYESDKKQDWKYIMEGIKSHPKDFVDKGGWEFLNPDGYESTSKKDDISIGDDLLEED